MKYKILKDALKWAWETKQPMYFIRAVRAVFIYPEIYNVWINREVSRIKRQEENDLLKIKRREVYNKPIQSRRRVDKRVQ